MVGLCMSGGEGPPERIDYYCTDTPCLPLSQRRLSTVTKVAYRKSASS